MKNYVRKINYYETDQMHIVHHSNYIRYFEEARLFWMEESGLAYDKVEEMQLIIPVLFVNAKYLKPARYGDIIEIKTKITKFDGLKFEYSYEIYNQETHELLVTGTSGHAFLTPDMKPVRLKRAYPELFESINKIVDECI